MVKVYRCKICGEGYIGDEIPSHCPFCGAHRERIVLANQWSWPKVELTDISKKNLQEALKLEISNSEFYFCAAKKTDNEADQTMFKRLAKVEKEHADSITKLLNIESPNISRTKDMCNPVNAGNLKESHEREENAIKHYSAFLSQATEERIKEFFSAIIEIEKDHLSLTEGRI